MKRVILIIMDGWGESDDNTGNAIVNARTPTIDMLKSYYPNTVLQASGVSVGLPWGTMGNSEVGHLTIGAGKVLYQNLPRVTLAIQDGSFFENEALLGAIKHAAENDSCIHVMGLVSDGAVHSHINHLYAILELLKDKGVPADRVFIHVFTDGRDVDPRSGKGYIADLENNIKNEGYPGKIATVMGRYYAMDRNKNWDRTQKAYRCMVNGVGAESADAQTAIEACYKKGITDEFIEPTAIRDENGSINTVKQNDSLIFFNIREDRARQISQAFAIDDFKDFDRGKKIQNLDFVTMVEYEKGLPAKAVFLPETVNEPLGKALSDAKMRQLRIAETEKYAHVTYFFNGGREEPFPGEDRLLIPSPSVDFYDKTPEMSAGEITQNVINAIEEGKYDFILVNFANPDMIGHTGNMKAAISAVEFIDKCLEKIYEAIIQNSMVMLVTADHGNVEEMINLRSGEKDTEHSVNPVPFILVDQERQLEEAQGIRNKTVGGMLSDIAPTILDLMGIQKPAEMTGTSLLESI